jgi:hypothetical protein
MALEQAFECLEALRHALRVVEAVDAQEQPSITEAGS